MDVKSILSFQKLIVLALILAASFSCASANKTVYEKKQIGSDKTIKIVVGGHTISPYREDEKKSKLLQDRAKKFCKDKHNRIPTEEFYTDGCSLVPDGTWRECCITHDIEYWCGGSIELKFASDKRIADCVEKKSNKINGDIYQLGPGLFAWGFTPTWFRWGYGYTYPMTKRKLEKSRIDRKQSK